MINEYLKATQIIAGSLCLWEEKEINLKHNSKWFEKYTTRKWKIKQKKKKRK